MIDRNVHRREDPFVGDVASQPSDPPSAPTTPIEPVFDYVESSVVVVAPERGRPQPARRRWRPWMTMAVSALAALVMAVIYMRRPDRRDGSPTTLFLAPFAVDGRDADVQLLGLMIADLLESRLEQVPGIAVHREAPDESRPSRATLAGSLARTTDARRAHLVVELREETRGGGTRAFTLGEFDLPFLREGESLQTFVQIRERVVQRLLDRLRPAFVLPVFDPSRPRNVEAYRLYLQASGRVLQSAVCDDAVLDLTNRSLEIDPDYAPAWVLLGWTQHGRVAACSEGAQHHQDALAAASRAATLDPLNADPVLLEAVTLTERGRLEDAYDRILANRMRGRSAALSFGAAYTLTYAGYLDEALHALDEALAQHPLYLTEGGWTPNVLLYQKQFERFLSLVPGTDAPIFRWYRGIAQLELGRASDAESSLRDGFERFPQDVFARLALATSAALQGQPDEARTAVLAISQHRETVGSRDGEVTLKQAQVLGLAGDVEGALAELTRAVDQGFACAPCIENTRLLEALHGSAAYQAALSTARLRHDDFGRRFGLANH